MTEYLKLCVKQGEELDVQFNIKNNNNPLDLTNYGIRFMVKKVPLVTSEPIINKFITTTSEANDVGIINNPNNGGFKVHLKTEDTSFAIGEYSLIIQLEKDNYIDIISSNCCNKAIYKINEQ